MSSYARFDRLQRRHRRREAPGTGVGLLLVPMAMGLLTAPFARPSILWFLGQGATTFREGLGGITLRLGLLICAIGILVGHDLVIRGTDRAVLDPLPIAPGDLLPVLRRRLLRQTLGVALGLCLLLCPLLNSGQNMAFFLSSVLILEAWVLGVALGCVSQLGAVQAAYSPSLEGLFNAIRGSNPRMEAALIYAPGIAVAVAGGALWLGIQGLDAALAAGGWRMAGLGAPAGVALAAWPMGATLARRSWYAATALVHEVDAAHAAVQNPADARRVYLEWAVRFLPGTLRPYALLRLRQGWRSLRTWVLGAWGLGGVSAFAAWSARPEASARAFLVASAFVLFLAAVAIRLEEAHPRWLDESLSPPFLRSVTARFIVTVAWLQGVVLPPVAALLIRQPGRAPSFLLMLEGLVLTCALLASLLGILRSRGYLVYAPLAVGAGVLAVRLFF